MYSNLRQEADVKKLAKDIQSCTKCNSAFPDNILTNIIAKQSKTGIGFWSDAYPNFSAKIMIVGQDWGSEKSVNNKHPRYEPSYWEPEFYSWETLMRLLKDAQFKTCNGDYAFTDIYLTNAVLCARKGNKDSGNIPDKYFDKCYDFLEEQIKIVKPKIIATLGKTVLDVFAGKFNIKYSKFYKIVATEIPIATGIVLFPLCHTSPLGLRNRTIAKKAGYIKADMVDDFKKLKDLLDSV